MTQLLGSGFTHWCSSLLTERKPMEARINVVLSKMAPSLNSKQLKHLSTVLRAVFSDSALFQRGSDNEVILTSFLTAKQVEGCSPKTIKYYRNTLVMMNEVLDKPYVQR